MTIEDTQYLNLAIEAATKAGHFLQKNIGKNCDIFAEEEREVHFQFDLEAEKIIISELQKWFRP
jgi:3'-phosphoadenosine 5'-phosphosulfate (PAPS) 3'-phosphatase